MNTDELWVVYNNVSNKILHVYVYDWQAWEKVGWYWGDKNAPVNGTVANTLKIEVKKLSEAILDIKDSTEYYHKHRHALD
jgi:hypothetical protein